MDAIAGGFWEWISHYGGWGAVALLAGFFVWLVLMGKLKTRSDYDQLQRTNDKLAETVATYSEAWPRVLAYMETADRFFAGLQKERDKSRGGGSE